MSGLRTQPTDQSVELFLSGITDDKKRQDSLTLSALMSQITGADPVMWGDSIVGFGSYRFRYASGREGKWFLTGFAPRKRNLTLYIMSGFSEYEGLLEKLGQFTTGKSCLYVKRLEDVDLTVLRELIRQSVKHVAESGT
jgi:hypothetical protein